MKLFERSFCNNRNNSEVDERLSSSRTEGDWGTRDMILFESFPEPVIKALDFSRASNDPRRDETRSSLLINCVIITLTILLITTGPSRFERLYNLTESLSESVLAFDFPRAGSRYCHSKTSSSFFSSLLFRCGAPRCNQF